MGLYSRFYFLASKAQWADANSQTLFQILGERSTKILLRDLMKQVKEAGWTPPLDERPELPRDYSRERDYDSYF